MEKLAFLKVLMPMLFRGLKVTLLIASLGILFGFIIGCILGFALQSKSKIARKIAGVYIWVIRGIPMIVLAMYIYYVIPKLIHVELSSNLAGIITLSLSAGAFISEIVRGALQSVDYGQQEAGLALGLSPMQTLLHVVIPPAFKSMLPALFNQFINCVKETALLSVIVVKEITKEIANYAAFSFNIIEAYTTGALFYLVIISILILIQKQFERKMVS